MVRILYPAALTVLVLLVACSGGDDSDGPPTLTASGASAPVLDTSTAGPSATDVPRTEIAVGDVADFPDDVALIVETGCWGCDGGTGALVRAYRRSGGSIAQDILFTPGQLNLPPDDDGQPPYILDFVIKPDAAEMAVAVCVTGFCGGLGPAAPEGAAATLYRSTDGGVTWAEWADWPLDHWMIGLVEDGVLAGHRTNISDKPDDPQPDTVAFDVEFVVLPGGRTLKPPAAADLAVWPVVTDFGEVWWPADNGRLLRDDGSVALTLPDDVAYASNPQGHPKAGVALSWYSDDVEGQLFSFYRGGQRQIEGGEFEYITTVSGIAHAGPLDAKAGILYGNVEASAASIPLPTPLRVGLAPAIIDLDTDTAHPIISPFLDDTSILTNQRNRIVAVQRGPFARVTTPGSCLNLRAEPSLSADILDCLADGVLLYADSRTTEADGVTWLEVLHLPSFPQGWVSTEFLER